MKNQSFYTLLSTYYDDIFPFDRDIYLFLTEHIPIGKDVLDLACGTGTYSCALAERGHRVWGIDLDEEMVKLSERKRGTMEANGKFKTGGTARHITGSMVTPATYVPTKVGAAYCIGNSLPHLSDRSQVLSMLQNVRDVLRDEGTFIIQNINFDRFDGKKSARLPTLDTESVTFYRDYTEISPEKLLFETRIEDKATGEEHRQSVTLLCLKKGELEDMLKRCGFRHTEFFGSYDGGRYKRDSFLTIAYALT